MSLYVIYCENSRNSTAEAQGVAEEQSSATSASLR